MKVYIPGGVLDHNWTGVQFYTAQLIDHLSRIDDVQITVACGRNAGERLGKQTGDRVRIETGVSRARGHDIIHLPTVHFPWEGRPPGAKVVMTFHDLVPLAMPQTHMRHYRVYFKYVLPRIARWLDAVVAVSDATADDVVRFYDVPRERIFVTGQGCRFEGDAPVTEPSQRERFVLAVGTLEPRKNLTRVIEAFIEMDDPTARLVIAGGRGWGDEPIAKMIANHEDRVEWTGYIETDQLRELYLRAALLVYPSLYEGFGLPVLEAMTLGCPVITSDVSSMPQVGGDAARYVYPHNTTALAAAMRDVLNDDIKRRAMARLGIEQAKQWTWPKCAERTAAIYRDLVG